MVVGAQRRFKLGLRSPPVDPPKRPGEGPGGGGGAREVDPNPALLAGFRPMPGDSQLISGQFPVILGKRDLHLAMFFAETRQSLDRLDVSLCLSLSVTV